MLVLSCLLLAGSFAEPVDETLRAGARGDNIVVAVLEKIEASRVFNKSEWFRTKSDRGKAKSFLRTLAYVRSGFGREDFPGGIWNISIDEFNATREHIQNKPILQERLNNSKYGLRINWIQDVSHMNMTIPLYAGLAAILLLDEVDLSIASVSDHSKLWIDHFGGTNLGDWLDAVNDLKNLYSNHLLYNLA